MFSLYKRSVGIAVLVFLGWILLPVRGEPDKPAPKEKGPLTGNALRLVSVKPEPPAVLKLGQKMEVKFRYSVDVETEVNIFVQYYGFPRTPLGEYDPSPRYKNGKGKASSSFWLNKPGSIEGFTIKMIDRKTKKTLASIKHPLKAEWK